MNLFDQKKTQNGIVPSPLADRIRPENLAEFAGQSHLLGSSSSLLRRAIEEDRVFSVIFWGPPGSGKTTLARIIAKETKSHFETFSAVLSGVKELRSVIAEAKLQLANNRKTVLFVDEIHRFNKAQQDAFLPHVENGLITLIGATTENPSFEVIAPLLSRVRVMMLKPYSGDELSRILTHALTDRERGLGKLSLTVDDDALSHIIDTSDGDARTALNSLEIAAALVDGEKAGERRITLKIVEGALHRKALQYDKTGEEHYNVISAFHKSMRGSDPDAALYWLGRMLEAGEDPLYIARRMVRFASEDVGNADPVALSIALSAMQAFQFIGLPEGELALAQAAVYLATAPKSNALYTGYGKVREEIRRSEYLPVPLHIRNAPTGLMKNLGYGKGYKYAHDYPDAHVPQEYLPDRLRGQIYYNPTVRGYEKIVRDRLTRWRKMRDDASKDEKKR